METKNNTFLTFLDKMQISAIYVSRLVTGFVQLGDINKILLVKVSIYLLDDKGLKIKEYNIFYQPPGN